MQGIARYQAELRIKPYLFLVTFLNVEESIIALKERFCVYFLLAGYANYLTKPLKCVKIRYRSF